MCFSSKYDARQMTDDNGQGPFAVGHPSESGDIKSFKRLSSSDTPVSTFCSYTCMYSLLLR